MPVRRLVRQLGDVVVDDTPIVADLLLAIDGFDRAIREGQHGLKIGIDIVGLGGNRQRRLCPLSLTLRRVQLDHGLAILGDLAENFSDDPPNQASASL